MQIKIKYLTSYLLEWLLSKRREITSVGEDVEKEESLCTADGNENWCSLYGKQHGSYSRN